MPSFPVIKAYGGVDIKTQLPYKETDFFANVLNELPCGKAYALNHRDSAIEHRVFVVRYNVIERDELAVLEDFMVEMGGRLGEFDFTDDEGTTWPNCRFEEEFLRPEYVQVNQYNVEVKIATI